MCNILFIALKISDIKFTNEDSDQSRKVSNYIHILKLKILLLTCANCTLLSSKSRVPSAGFSTSGIKISKSDGEETLAGLMFISPPLDTSLQDGKFNVGKAPYFKRKAAFLFW